ncbi:class I SAM-dependent methyltransferase [Rhizobium deserti]|uniref:Class I SAM-dependent methyltransferase n=1 Tax=Rhizobium deserti TaxID=2547961 RepID=A0A4R5UHL8_9HYPH|nr:class I SAM-dependent methyltransferase [Rhizobium deserti]TDK35352.1 class I SAM-dependent methyltransferase [Rhizobium deserti]
MAAADDPTRRFYATNAVTYTDFTLKPSALRLERFLALLPEHAEILELGCGNGRDSAFMIERGYHVSPTDGTPEMATEASRRLGIRVDVLGFEDIAYDMAFDGIWANACLLHVPRSQLGLILFKIHAALRSGGVFYASYKAGTDEGVDTLGRYYNFPSENWLRTTYESLAWASFEMRQTRGGEGYDNQPTEWLHVTAVKA